MFSAYLNRRRLSMVVSHPEDWVHLQQAEIQSYIGQEVETVLKLQEGQVLKLRMVLQ